MAPSLAVSLACWLQTPPLPTNTYAPPVLIVRQAVRGGQLRLLDPGRPRSHEDIGSARAAVPPRRPDQRRVPRKGHRPPEQVVGKPDQHGELRLLAPRAARAREHV